MSFLSIKGNSQRITATAEGVSYTLPVVAGATTSGGNTNIHFLIPQGFPGLPGPPGQDATERVYATTSGEVDADTLLRGPAYYFIETGATLANFPEGYEAPLYLEVENNVNLTSVKQVVTGAMGQATRIGTTEDAGWADGVGDIDLVATSRNGALYYAGYVRFEYTGATNTLTLTSRSNSVLFGIALQYTQGATDPINGPNAAGVCTLNVNYEVPDGGIIQLGDTVVAIFTDGDWVITTGPITRPDYEVDITGGAGVANEDGTSEVTLNFTGYYQRKTLAKQTASEWVSSSVAYSR